MRRLLVMSCGKRKRLDASPLPAILRYDGPAFRVLRRYLATLPASPPDVYILSARFGLIAADRPIPYYDQRVKPERAVELQPAVLAALAGILARGEYEQLYLAVGQDYARALDGHASLTSTMLVSVAHGSQGARLSQLHHWLYGTEIQVALESAERPGARRLRRQLRLRGLEVTLSAPEALALAREQLAINSYGCDRFHSWYVLLDDGRIAPKWLVSRISGLPVGTFTTTEALRVLGQIGIPVHPTSSD